MTHTTRNLLAASLALGMVMATSSAMAKDPPKTTDHSAMTHADKHDSAEPVTDSWITTKVKADLLTSKNVPGTEVMVETVNGVVTLKGTVATQAEHDKALRVTQGIKGVKRVDASGLKVAPAAAKR
ncbi:BON domain-containing protein [Stenotrophomonas sp.]|uniref:BON domain-containing protein n=1 Tax=Stenotrophomonas sp. TaxID=69392 RepID=UPI002FC5CA7B